MDAGTPGTFKMGIKFSNNAESFLRVDIGAASTILPVGLGTAAKFDPLTLTTDFEYLTITDGANFEIVRVNSWLGDVASIARAQGGTTARAWPLGTLVVAKLCTPILEAFKQGHTALVDAHIMAPGSATLDLGVAYNSIADIPKLIVLEYDLSTATNRSVYLPSIATQSEPVYLRVWKQDYGSTASYGRVYVKTGEYLDNVVSDYAYLHSTSHVLFVGRMGRWDSGII